jgi:hypothetical protein
MSKTAKILVAAAIVASTATSAFAQGYYYGQLPAEQRHWYDRNAVGQNV